MTTRFAPSPTGYLHVGGLRTALYSYLHAKKYGGKFLLRIEDTDLKRNSQEATEAILEAFKWCGLSHDEEIFYQSKRFDIYKKYIDRLLKEGKAYKCYMSREELDALRESQIAKKERPRYDGRYRDFTGTPPEGIEPVIRIKTPLDGAIEFEDGIKGHLKFNVKDVLDDFIIARSDGTPTYNFVVTVDDALMGVSDVIRGDDHTTNTPKQIVIYKALGFEVPKFYHVPMINNEQGKKLSKRDGATDVMEYKEKGFLPEALLNFLVRLGWSHGDQEIFSLEQMIKYFDANDVNAAASSYNLDKLLWINSQYINKKPIDELEILLKDFGLENITCKNKNLLFGVAKERSKTLIDLSNEIQAILQTPQEYDQKVYKKAEANFGYLKEFLSLLHVESNKDEYEKIANEYLTKNDLGLGKLAQPLRLALLGKMGGAGVFEIMEIIGLEESKKRIQNLCEEH
ncbi:MAG: glutamate--tRNA ligase [Campylobacteraceae bacterium]|nr:glutamate--tRNA ligase [Campylobacteraceae bacterium]